MNVRESRELLEENPRDYCYCLEDSGRKFYFSPMAHVIGRMLNSGPGYLKAAVRAGQRWQKQYRQAGRELRYPWPESLLTDERPEEAVRKGVKKTEGAYHLWDIQPREKIRSITLKGTVLSGSIRSKSSRSRTTPTLYEPHFRSAFVNEYGDPDIIEMLDTCPQAGWTGGEKGGRVLSRIECVHLAGMLDAFWDRWHYRGREGIRARGSHPKRGLFNPFSFAGNWTYRDGRPQASNREFASLEVDMMVSRYVNGEGYFSLNSRALDIPWIPSPTLQRMISDGRVTREVVVGGKKRVRSRKKAEQKAAVCSGVFRALSRNGYRFSGRCLEFGEIALHYTHAHGHSVNLVVSDVPYIVVRTGQRGKPSPFHRPPDLNPLSLIGRRNLFTYDDRTMSETETRVELPSALRLPETRFRAISLPVPKALKRAWRRELMKVFGGRAEAKLKYARLLYGTD